MVMGWISKISKLGISGLFRVVISYIKGKFRSKITNRKVTKVRFLYLYVIFGSIAGLLYFGVALFLNLPKHWAFSPLYLLGAYVLFQFLYKNGSVIWNYIVDKEQGRLLLYMQQNTHFEPEHQRMAVKWVYLKRKTVRNETYFRIMDRLQANIEITKEEKALLKYKTISCPQQLRDGINEAIFIDVLIYAHENIQVLDKELRRIMNLNENNILSFDLNREIDKCRADKYKKYREVGEKVSKKLSK